MVYAFTSMGPIQAEIEECLKVGLAPRHLEVINESHLHEGHAHMGPETHFRIVAISEKFEGLKSLARHRLVHGLLAELLKEQIHALTLQLFSPRERAE
ncbi:MAG: BolA family protein [Bdellovibrionia bacterium]